ncbi:hypothetical protein EVAR_92247_1 [Eumeta japonica]|uniref:Uncharacterized protein n=1 Tax=Eumeta variegata TaxID=151549 RepID=A0A4C1TNI7_EUMVA|nr:hypothetical protein EVAR_92247_1 [Eumeta japonica]
MIKRSVLPSAITSTARNSGPGRYGRVGSAGAHTRPLLKFQSELDIMLRDRFILGLQDVRERERLFTEDAGKITFVAAMELVQSVQCARLRDAQRPGIVAARARSAACSR